MTTFEDLYCKAKSAAEAAGKKTGELVELTKLKLAAAEAEKELAASFEKLGRLVYTARQTETDSSVEIDTMVQLISRQKEALSELREAIAAAKNGTLCTSCGTVNDEDAAYCKKCGNAL